MQTPQARRYSRLRDLGGDQRVNAIREAIRKCSAGGRARGHLMNGDTKWPEQYVAALDDLAGSAPEELIGVGDAMREAAFATALAGSRVPAESPGEVLALEAIAEGEANRDVAKLIDAPHCESRKRAAVRSLSWHATMIERAKRVLLRDLSSGNGAARV